MEPFYKRVLRSTMIGAAKKEAERGWLGFLLEIRQNDMLLFIIRERCVTTNNPLVAGGWALCKRLTEDKMTCFYSLQSGV